MDIEKIMEFKNYYKRTETENIHKEIFEETSDYKHYMLGVAQGFYLIYDTISKFKNEIQ